MGPRALLLLLSNWLSLKKANRAADTLSQFFLEVYG